MSRPAVTDSVEPLTRAGRVARAVAYTRVSGLGQVEGDGPERQRLAIESYAAQARLDVVAWFADPGVSGTRELEHRAGLSALVERVREGDVGAVIVERADRLARDALVHALIVRRLVELGVKVVAADSGTDLAATDSPTGRFVATVLAALAELDRALTVSRLRAARERVRQRTGRCEGVRPYGEREGEAAALERIRALRRKPRNRPRPSFAEIARVLQAEGFRTRTGAPWSRQVVREIAERIRAE